MEEVTGWSQPTTWATINPETILWIIEVWSRKGAGVRETCSLLSTRTRVPAGLHNLWVKANMERYCSQQVHISTVFSGSINSSQREDIPEKLKFRVLQAIILHGKVGSRNEHSRTTTGTPSIVESQEELGNRNNYSSKTTTAFGRGWSCKNRLGGAKEKPPKTTSSIWRDCPYKYGHGWLTKGTTYPAAKTIRWVYPARGGPLRTNRPFCQQGEAARRWPSKTRTQRACFQDHAKAGTLFPWVGDWGILQINRWA